MSRRSSVFTHNNVFKITNKHNNSSVQRDSLLLFQMLHYTHLRFGKFAAVSVYMAYVCISDRSLKDLQPGGCTLLSPGRGSAVALRQQMPWKRLWRIRVSDFPTGDHFVFKLRPQPFLNGDPASISRLSGPPIGSVMSFYLLR